MKISSTVLPDEAQRREALDPRHSYVVQAPAVLRQRAAVVEGAPRDAAAEPRAAPEPGLALP